MKGKGEKQRLAKRTGDIFVCEGVHIGTVAKAPQMPTMSNPRRKSVWE